MLVTKIFAFASAAIVAAAVAVTSNQQLAANLEVSVSDLNKLLSATDMSSLDITKYAKALQVDPQEIASWSESIKVSTLEQLQDRVQGLAFHSPNRKRQESNRDKVQKEVDGLIADYRADHESDHGRRLAGCPSTRCTVCATGLTVAYIAGLTTCGAAAVSEDVISAGTLTPVAVTQLGACVGLAHSTYAGGWTFCLGMKD